MGGSDFNFSLEDLASNDAGPFVAQQNKHLPTGKPLVTTRSAAGQTASSNLSTLSFSQSLMNIPLFNDPTVIAEKLQGLVGQLGAGFQAAHAGSSDENEKAVTEQVPGWEDFTPDSTQNSLINPLPPDDTSTGATGTGSGGGAGTAAPGDNSSGGSSDGALFIQNPHVHFQGGSGGSGAKQNFIDGKMAPNLVRVLTALTQQWEIWISSGIRVERGSLHQDGRAVDIPELKNIATGEYAHIGHTANYRSVTLQAVTLLTTIPVMRSTGQCISPAGDPSGQLPLRKNNDGGGAPGIGFWYQADHDGANGHIHLGVYLKGDPDPAKASTTTANDQRAAT